jgi:ABC-type glycerol-3-phosphate transport system substrate-binding protein
MKLRTLLAAAALTLSTAAVHPAAAEDMTLEFTVWNYSLDTIEDNARKFEAENPASRSRSPTIPGRITMTAWCCA